MIFDAYDGNKKKKRVGVPVKQDACRSGDLPLKHSPIVDENICSIRLPPNTAEDFSKILMPIYWCKSPLTL
jgi:hypothetical protein